MSTNETTAPVSTLNEYKPNSQILRAYTAGVMPASHRILYNALIKALNGATEGEVDFANVLLSVGVHRSSAMTAIKHMMNFGVIEFSTSYTSIPGKRGEWHSYIKLLRDPEEK
jgi:hypothetical protein